MTGARAFAQENTSAEFTYTGSNDSDYKGQSTVVIEGKANSGNTAELQCVTVDMRKLAQFKNAKVLKFAKESSMLRLRQSRIQETNWMTKLQAGII